MNAPLLRPLGTRLPDWLRSGRAASNAASTSPRAGERQARLDDISTFLNTHDLSVTSQNLRIAHEQMSGDPATVAAIAALLREHGQLTDAMLADLTPPEGGVPAGLVSDVAGALAQRLGEVLRIVTQSRESARDYGVALDEQLRIAERDPVKALDRLIPLTRDVVDATRQMEERLDSARRETESLRAKVQSARRDADRDHLTGLPNRRWFDTRLGELALDSSATVAICDIDDFKAVNDKHGHEAGDRVLRFFARLLKSELGRHADVARYGGEEFVCLFERGTTQEAHDRLDAVRASLAKRTLVNQETGARVGPLAFSAGVAAVTPDRRSAMRRADDALYQAKRSGKDCIVTG